MKTAALVPASSITARSPAAWKPVARARGFTMIEVLVVMVIVIVLAALVIPFAGNMKKRAMRVESAARLRTISAAVAVYGGDNNGDMPIDGGASTKRWTHRIKQYVGAENAKYSAALYEHKVYRDAPTDHLIKSGGDARGTWGYNSFFNQGTGKSSTGQPWKRDSILDPSATPLFASLSEKAGLTLNVTGPSPLAEEYGYSGPTHKNGPSPNHDGTTFYLMADGSVKITSDRWPWKDNIGTSFHPKQNLGWEN